jgi:hypothetical protein
MSQSSTGQVARQWQPDLNLEGARWAQPIEDHDAYHSQVNEHRWKNLTEPSLTHEILAGADGNPEGQQYD